MGQRFPLSQLSLEKDMANQEHLDIFRQGKQTWNAWREQHPDIRPDLSHADFTSDDVRYMNLQRAILWRVDFTDASLIGTDLREADLDGADFSFAFLNHAHLEKSRLTGTSFRFTDLSGAHLEHADVRMATFYRTTLTDANFTGVRIGQTTFGDLDLRSVKGLETLVASFPSTLGMNTVERSKGKLPDSFLRLIGLSDEAIRYVHTVKETPLYTPQCFLAYSWEEKAFADRLYEDLQQCGIRCWHVPHYVSAESGSGYTDEGVGGLWQPGDRFIVVASAALLAHERIKFEIGTAGAVSRQEKQPTVLLLRLGDFEESRWREQFSQLASRWPTYDFSHWQDDNEYHHQLHRLVQALRQRREQ